MTRCPDCGEERQLAARPAAQTRSAAVTASVDPRRTLQCDRGCADAEQRLGAAVDRALDAGLTFGHGRSEAARCPACEELLDLPMRATVRSVTVEPDDGAPFTLTFTLPLVRCGRCGADNVPPGLHDAVRTSAHEVSGVRAGGRSRGRFSWLRRRGARGSL